MLGSLRDIVWRSTWDKAYFEVVRSMYISSCLDHGGFAMSFEDLPQDLPLRFSIILSIVSEAMICGLREGEHIEIKGYLKRLREELLKLYSDLLLEEKEYGLRLRPHRIEDLLRILTEE